MHPYKLKQEYDRDDLLKFVGSRQPQTGVIWGPKEPGCVIVTSGGRHGKKVGYLDERREDGCWLYFGQGRSGNHREKNSANIKLMRGNQSILLFSTREPSAKEVKVKENYRKLFAFEGLFNISGYEWFVPLEGIRKGDKLLRFVLVPAQLEVDTPSENEWIVETLTELRARLNLAAQAGPTPVGISLREYRYRNQLLRKYARARAAGYCESCAAPAPFIDQYGNGFLEVHHINRLADDGLDSTENVAAICPNCHRRAHHSADREEFKDRLLSITLGVELKLSLS